MPADVEDDYMVAQAKEPLEENGRFTRPKVNVRYRSTFLEIDRDKADYMDAVSYTHLIFYAFVP